MTKTKRSATKTTKTTVQYGKVRSSFITKRAEAKPAGVAAGRKMRGAVTTGAATVVAGLGVAAGAVWGFGKGFFGN